jgi:uncharacterized membrane protein
MDAPATQGNLLELAQARVIGLRAYERALKIIGHTPNAGMWRRFLDVVLLVLGAGFTVAGIYFFFAYNWWEMHRFVKLGIAEGVILILITAAALTSLDKLPGKITLTVAGMLIGALLAVFGQVYQTGADSYMLFVSWAVLMAAWVFISRFSPMWFIWILVIDTAFILFWDQMIGYGHDPLFWMCLFLINMLFVVAWEVFSDRIDWLVSRWTPRLLSLIALYAVTVPAVEFVSSWGYLRMDEQNTLPRFFMLVVFLLTNAVTIYFYSQKRLDLFILTLSAVSLMIVLTTWVANLLDSIGDYAPLLLGIFIILETAVIVTLLLWTLRAWEARKQ